MWHFGLWHDRAVFHFLTDVEDRRRYLATMSKSLEPEGSVIIGTFAKDAPAHCSGLEVAHYSPAELDELLGPDFNTAATRREIHHTPSGATQPFSWIAAQRHRSPE